MTQATEAGGFGWVRRLPGLWLLSAAGWTFVVLLMALRKYVTRLLVFPPGSFSAAFRGLLPDYAGYALFSPLVILLAERFPVGRTGRGRALLVHCGGWLVFSLASALVTVVADVDVYPRLPDQPLPPVPVRWQYWFAARFADDLVAYAAIVALVHALVYHRAHRAREIRAARLEARLSRARLEVLRLQLQPHFLFNTLNSISALMATEVPAARRMIADLKELLRLSLERSGAQEVALRDELHLLQRYVDIQRVRFRDRLTVEYRVDPALLGVPVPRLVLQPLVENSIRHGLAPRSSPGRVEVRAERDGAALRLVVADDGVGLSAGGGQRDGAGIGLGNTRARLQGLYGERQSLEVRPTPGGGVTVEVRLPIPPERDPA